MLHKVSRLCVLTEDQLPLVSTVKTMTANEAVNHNSPQFSRCNPGSWLYFTALLFSELHHNPTSTNPKTSLTLSHYEKRRAAATAWTYGSEDGVWRLKSRYLLRTSVIMVQIPAFHPLHKNYTSLWETIFALEVWWAEGELRQWQI